MNAACLRTPRAGRLVCIVGAWLLALAPVDAIAAEPQGSPPAATQVEDARPIGEQIADAIEFRSEFGFSTDLSTVSALLGDPTADRSFAVPLSRTERANMEHRLAMRDDAEAALTFVASHTADFGGVYFTQSTGELVIYVLPVETSDPALTNKVLTLIPAGLRTEVRAVTYSMKELLDAEARLALRTDDLQINEVGLDVVNNGLEVVFAPGARTASAVDLAGVPVAVSFGKAPSSAACSDSSSCTPYRGGIGIQSPQSGLFCTWGFYGTRGTSSKYIITAGHCALLGNTESHLGVVFSDGVDRDTFDSGARESDSLTAHVKASPNAVSPFNTIFAHSGDRAHVISGRRATTSQVAGDAVCFMGGATGQSLCGTIEATGLSYSLTREIDGRTLSLTGQIRMSRVTKKGDSGGPVYQGGTAYGVVNALAGGTSKMLYSPIISVQSNMGTTICITASC